MRDQINKGNNLLTPLNSKRKSIFQGGERKSMKTRKFMASLLVFAMLLALVPMGAVSAAGTTYSALSVPQLTANTTPSSLGTLVMKFDPIKDYSSAIIKFDNAEELSPVAVNIATSGAIGNITVAPFGNGGNEVKVEVTAQAGKVEEGTAYLDFKVKTKAAGDITANITALEGQFENGTVVLGTIGAGSVTITVDKVNNIAGNNNPVKVRLAESRAGALKAGAAGFVTLRLPDGFTFAAGTTYTALAGTQPATITLSALGSRDLTIAHAATLGTKGIVDLDLVINVNDKTAKHGDVIMNVRGEQNIKFNVDELLIAKYADFGTTVAAEEAKSLVAGLNAKKVATITIGENAPKSLVKDRTIYLTLPTGVKWSTTAVAVSGTNGVTVERDNALLDSGRTLKLVVSGTSIGNAGTVKITEPTVNTAVGFAGDVVVTASGNSGVTGEATVATVAAPLTVDVEKKDVKIGVRNQDIGKITITENKAKNLIKNGWITIELVNPYSGSFDLANAKATVVNSDDLALANVDGNNKLKLSGGAIVLQVKDQSYKKAGTIEITGLRATLDRAVPEGDVLVKVNGNAVNVSNFGGDMGYILETAIATVVTPAPDNNTGFVGEVKFVIDAKTYTVNGEEKSMDVAPYIQDGRTMLPVRFVAEALGVSEDNIIWDATTKTVTIMKGDRIAQMVIGSKVMVVNGVNVNMDTAAALKDGRTVLPLRFAAQALGANIEWDDATRTVTIN